MTVRFLNCGSMRPYFPRVINGVTCFLVETNLGPVLVDTGFGTRDYLSLNRSMKFFLTMIDLENLNKNKKASRRPKDLVDLKKLRQKKLTAEA